MFCSAPRSFINCIFFAPPPFPDVEPCAGSRRARPEHQHRPQREIALIARHRSLTGAIAPDGDPFPDCLIYGISGDGLADTRLPADKSVPSVHRIANEAWRRVSRLKSRIDLIAENNGVIDSVRIDYGICNDFFPLGIKREAVGHLDNITGRVVRPLTVCSGIPADKVIALSLQCRKR